MKAGERFALAVVVVCRKVVKPTRGRDCQQTEKVEDRLHLDSNWALYATQLENAHQSYQRMMHWPIPPLPHTGIARAGWKCVDSKAPARVHPHQAKLLDV